MTRYTDLRHAGYFADGLSDKQRAAIEAEVDKTNGQTPTKPAAKSTTKPK